jgi:hypothetical protein
MKNKKTIEIVFCKKKTILKLFANKKMKTNTIEK